MENAIYDNARRAIAAARQNVRDKALSSAFVELRKAAAASPALLPRIDRLEAEYFYMLRFVAAGNDVSDLAANTAATAAGVETLLRIIERTVKADTEPTIFAGMLRYARRRPEENLESLISDYLAELDNVRNDTASLTDTGRRKNLERMASDIFNRLWIETGISTDERTLLSSILADDTIPAYDRVLWLNAIGLSLLDSPDDAYLGLLAEARQSGEAILSTAAAVWFVLAVNAIDSDSNDIDGARIADMTSSHPEDIPTVILEWCRSLGTDSISQSLNINTDPRLREIGRKFNEKLRNADPEKLDELMMNSEWLTENIGSEGFDSMKNFIDAQRNGDDVFMATLGKMRSFPFFGTLSNWFLPFHTAHSALAPVVDGEGAALAETIAIMPNLCDSDKFALLLSMAQTPAQMRDAALAAMSQQMHSAMNSDEMQEMIGRLSPDNRRVLINNHIKNIYRFFNLFHARGEFRNILASPPSLLTEGASYGGTMEEIADTLFRLRRYREAAEAYRIAAADGTLPVKALQKQGYACELSGMQEKAVEIYNDILTVMPGDKWTIIRLASTLLCRKDAAAALELLKPYEDSNSEDIEFLSLLAAAYTSLNRWTEAANIYHNIDYIQPENNNSAKGDLAWALTLAGDYEAADIFFDRADDDIINKRRHALMMWLAGRRHEAAVMMAKATENDDIRTLSPEKAFGKEIRYIKENIAGGDTVDLLLETARYARHGGTFGSIL